MIRFYAICPFCKKSIFVEESATNEYTCPVCGETLDFKFLQTENYIIDITAADSEYKTAQQYFVNADFKAAEERFLKTLEFNPNHYLACYYVALCEIYENENKEDFDVSKRLSIAITNSVIKLGLSQANLNTGIEFLNAVLSQSQIIMTSYFNRICDNYEKTEKWDILRNKCLDIALAIKDIANIDKEKLMVFDPTIVKYLTDIADIGICSCRKVAVTHLITDKLLDSPTDYQYEKAQSCHSLLLYYISSLDHGYKAAEYKPDYTANLLFNQNTLSKLDNYNEKNKSLRKKCLSTAGEVFEDFRKHANIAIKYSYQTCFKSFSTSVNDQARIALINDCVSFCFELLIPRFYIDADKKLIVNVNKFSQSKEYSTYLDAFLCDLSEYNAKLTTEYANRFFVRLHEKIKLHFSAVYANYNKIVNKIKESQNAEYRYYKNFLHSMIYSCALALKEVVPYCSHTLTERIKILKLGKQICDEFLLLNDYNVEELEQSVKYSDVLDIYNAFDRSIEDFTIKK